MLELHFSASDFYDGNSFVDAPAVTLQLEHSLLAVSKWEGIWEKPFMGQKSLDKTEFCSYILCMMVAGSPPPFLEQRLTNEHVDQVQTYMSRKSTATWFTDYSKKTSPSNEVITSEIIYYWMIAYQVPPEYERWHLQKLMTLLQVCERKSNQSNRKMSRQEILARNRELNAQRRKATNSTG